MVVCRYTREMSKMLFTKWLRKHTKKSNQVIEKIAKEIAVNLVTDVIDASNIKKKEMSR